jgi:hypothetical protein
MHCTRRRADVARGEKFSRACTKMLRTDVSRCRRERRDANHLALDSLVFDRNDHREMPPQVLLWKKKFTWVKPTQRHHFAMLLVFIERDFLRARETGIDFVICARTSIT